MSDESRKRDESRLGDMPIPEFRAAAHRVADQTADYLERVADYRVVPDIRPGEVRARIPERPPADPESIDRVLQDYAEWVEPNVTHWQHPGFLAYFPSVASAPGILGEWLSAGLNSNVMFWKNAPASTEIEERVVQWLREMLGLPPDFDGMLTDTASISTLLSLVVARHAVPGLEAKEQGLAGRPGLRPLRLYASSETHSSIDKAAVVIGVGLEGLRRIEVDETFAMRPEALERAIREDRAAGWLPFCVVGTLGTTSSTGIDPAAAIAEICAREGLWFHVDAAFGGAAALAEEYRPLFAGWEQADTVVFNPHKWMFTPFDASLLLFRDPALFRSAFSLVPDYLRDSAVQGAHNFNEYGVQLGRRFRSLKLWMLIRYFGTRGIAERVREHCNLARELAGWIEAEPGWELMAPVPLSLVCFRFRPDGPATTAERLDALNLRIMESVNRDGRFYLSGTRLAGRFVIRLVIGNPRTTREHVRACWQALTQAAARGQ